MRRLLFVYPLLLVVAFGPGCGDDEPGNNQFGNNNVSNAGDDTGGDAGTDAGDDTGETGGDGGADTSPDADVDPDVDAGDGPDDLCEATVDLGELDSTTGATSSGDTADGTSFLEPSCGAEGSNETFFEFSAAEDIRVRATVESGETDDWILALYEGSCQEPEELSCNEGRSDVFTMETDDHYFLAVETADGELVAPFGLELDPEGLDCSPVGSTSCDDRGRVVRCETDNDEVAYNCAYPCQDEACGGDTCQTALEVAGDGTHTFDGSYEGYANTFNFDGQADCGHTGDGPNTPGQDLVFSLPGLSENQQVTVDASQGDGQYGFFVLETCSTDAQCVTGGLEVDDALDWTVPADGDYYIVVDLLEDESDGDFDITVSR